VNGFTWLQDKYCLRSSINLENFESRSFERKTLDGRNVYILKDQFNLLPKEIQDAFKKINQIKFHEFQHLTWKMQAIVNKKENYTQLQRIINIDTLKVLKPYLSVNTKQVFCLSSHLLKEVVGKTSLKYICEDAALEGNLEVLKWARKNGAPWDVWTCACAAGHGHLTVLKWARENGAPWDVQTCRHAAKGGHLEVLKWARKHGALWDEWTCIFAAKNGHLGVLKWVRNNGAPWDVLTCGYAAEGGHLDVLKWARRKGAPWDVLTCGYAAKGGHLEVLKWARKHGALWDEWTCIFAAKNGHLRVLKWAKKHKAPWNIDLIRSTASQEVKKWLEVNP
jgi:hypothetical protein